MFVSEEVHKQTKEALGLNYRAATRKTNFGSTPVEPKTKRFMMI